MRILQALFLVCLSLCGALSLRGQILDKAVLKNIVSKNPEATTIESFTNTPVNNATGIPEIQLPIYTLEAGDFKLPIALRYHASGVKVDELSTAVGLKWILSAGGSIDRSINGKADESSYFTNYKRYTRSYFDSLMMTNETYGSQAAYGQMLRAVTDIMVDEYSYNLPGFSGNLMFNNSNGKFYAETQSSELDVDGANLSLNTFTITDDKGNRYFFGGNYKESGTSYLSNAGALSPDDIGVSYTAGGVNSWKLYRIVTNKKDTINFEYEPYSYDYHTASEYIYGKLTFPSSTYMENCGCGDNFLDIRFLDYAATAYLIKKITSRFGSIQFNYATSPTAKDWKRRLTDIVVYNSNNIVTRKFQLDNETVSGGKLFLTALHKIDPTNGERKESYQFKYTNMSVDTVGSLGKDIMGYANGSINQTLIAPSPGFGFSYPFTPADRDPSNVIANGLLTEVVYPTGGKARYTYMMNKEGTTYAGGVIVKKIELMDKQNNLLNQKMFTYSGLKGRSISLPAFTNMTYGNDGDGRCQKWIFSSKPTLVAEGGPRSYYYSEIIVSESGADTGKAQVYKEKYEPQYYMNGTTTPVLKEKIVYKGAVPTDNNMLEKTVFENKVVQIDSLAQFVFTPGESFIASTGNYWNGMREYDCPRHYRSAYMSNIYNAKKGMPVSAVRTLFDVVSNQQITTTMKYYYDSKAHFYPTRTVTYASNNDSVTSFTVFPTDTVLTGPEETARKFMLTKHMYVLPIVEGAKNNISHTVSASYSYLVNADSMLLINSISTKTGGNAVDTRILFKQYDGNGNLLEQSKANDISEVYIWGYKNTYPVAKVAGSNYNYIKTLIDNNLLQSMNPDEQQLRNELNKIRTALKGKAFVSTYTYMPQVGVTSETNPAGLTTYFEYDGLGRLVIVRDHDRKIVKTIDYQYQAPISK